LDGGETEPESRIAAGHEACVHALVSQRRGRCAFRAPFSQIQINNCYRDYAQRNAEELADLLKE
jgi:hypothetical protein